MPTPVHHRIKHLVKRLKEGKKMLSFRPKVASGDRSGGIFANETNGHGLDTTDPSTTLGMTLKKSIHTPTIYIICATLIFFPFALSPVSSDPSGAGRLALLLIANAILFIMLAVSSLRTRVTPASSHVTSAYPHVIPAEAGIQNGIDCIDSGSEPGMTRGTLRMTSGSAAWNDKKQGGTFSMTTRSIYPFIHSPLSILLALILTLVLILISPNRAVALESQQARVILVLLFYLAARKLLYKTSLAHPSSVIPASSHHITSAYPHVIPAEAGIQNGIDCIDSGSEPGMTRGTLRMTSGSTARNDKRQEALQLVKKAWLTGLVIIGMMYLLFTSQVANGLFNEAASKEPPRLPRPLSGLYTTARTLIAPQFNLTRPDWQTSLRVATSTLAHSPLTGSGLGRYSSAFSAYRGSAFNYSPNWNLKFSSSFSTLFNWVTEGGAIGLIVYIFLFLPGLLYSFLAARKIFNLKFLIFNQFSMMNFLIMIGLVVGSTFFSYGLAGYFYTVTGYLILSEN